MIECNGKLLYEEGGDLDENELALYTSRVHRPLSSLGVTARSILGVSDFSQDFSCSIEIASNHENLEDPGYVFCPLSAPATEEVLEEAKIPVNFIEIFRV